LGRALEAREKCWTFLRIVVAMEKHDVIEFALFRNVFRCKVKDVLGGTRLEVGR